MFLSIRYRVFQCGRYCSPCESLYACLCVHVSSQQNVILETSSCCSGKYIKGGFEHFCGCLPDRRTICGQILGKTKSQYPCNQLLLQGKRSLSIKDTYKRAPEAPPCLVPYSIIPVAFYFCEESTAIVLCWTKLQIYQNVSWTHTSSEGSVGSHGHSSSKSASQQYGSLHYLTEVTTQNDITQLCLALSLSLSLSLFLIFCGALWYIFPDAANFPTSSSFYSLTLQWTETAPHYEHLKGTV